MSYLIHNMCKGFVTVVRLRYGARVRVMAGIRTRARNKSLPSFHDAE